MQEIPPEELVLVGKVIRPHGLSGLLRIWSDAESEAIFPDFEAVIIDPSVMHMLTASPWRGNIRELENTIERAILLADGETITTDLLGFQSHDSTGNERDQRLLSLKEMVEETEKLAIQQVLAETDGNRTATAKRLGIARRTLYDKMAVYALE